MLVPIIMTSRTSAQAEPIGDLTHLGVGRLHNCGAEVGCGSGPRGCVWGHALSVDQEVTIAAVRSSRHGHNWCIRRDTSAHKWFEVGIEDKMFMCSLRRPR